MNDYPGSDCGTEAHKDRFAVGFCIGLLMLVFVACLFL